MSSKSASYVPRSIGWLLVVGIVGYSLFAGNFTQAQTDKVVPFASVAKQIPESNTEIIAINDLAGHLEAALSNRALERVLSEGSFAELAKSSGSKFPVTSRFHPAKKPTRF